ncbi:hypothetical protein BC937DRAFT_88532 [Endogone sp. FLAS-F59071]|nr:hypothetical protein BC937DRAFT_88532 [Endogone sp. FLAS-F59071]|eukprot:RUS18623.1 hypothetical protein BC937DRAFT_88532 [Endogone sp. FLAS-F59071]
MPQSHSATPHATDRLLCTKNMRLALVLTVLALYLDLAPVEAKGGGGSHSHSGSSSKSSGSHTSGSGSGRYSSSSRPASYSRPVSTNRFSTPTSVRKASAASYQFAGSVGGYPKGGYGYYGRAPVFYGWTRYSYYNYVPTYGGYWGPGYQYGWYGQYNPSWIYWYVLPSANYQGYTTKYYRYNYAWGAYYAPMLSISGSSTLTRTINATEYTDDTNNYHTSFVFDLTAGYPSIDAIYYSTSDPSANMADYTFRVAFWELLEFLDTNGNGQFDDSVDVVINTIPLNRTTIPWAPLTLFNRTLTGTNRTYIEGETTAELLYNQSTSIPTPLKFFNATFIFRASNLQINSTSFALPLEPNSAAFEFSVTGFPFASNLSRLAVIAILSAPDVEPTLMDIHTSNTPAVMQRILTDLSVGVSIGDYSDGRFEWKSSILVTNITSLTFRDPMAALLTETLPRLVGTPYATDGCDNVSSYILAMTVPKDSVNILAGSANISGFSYLDTDVLSSETNGARRNAARGVVVASAVCAMLLML